VYQVLAASAGQTRCAEESRGTAISRLEGRVCITDCSSQRSPPAVSHAGALVPSKETPPSRLRATVQIILVPLANNAMCQQLIPLLMALAMNCLLTEPILKTVSTVTSTPSSRLARP